MSFFDASIPADTEGVKLGASRMREIKSAMNTLISQIWDDSGVFLNGWVTAALVSTSTLVDSARAIGAYAIKTGSITLRALKSGTLFFANELSRSYFDDQIWNTAKLSADISLTTSGSFVQPAIGSSVTVATTADPVAAGILSGGPTGIKMVTAADFVQPAVASTVLVTVSADPVAAGVVAGMRVKCIDGSFVNDYLVTSATSSPFQVTLNLVTLNGPSIATTTIPSGTFLFTASRTVTIPDGSGVDTYVISAATTTPNVTLTLVSVGGSQTPGTTIPTAQVITSLGAVLSADAAGRARMADGFFTADAAGHARFATGFFDSSIITFSGGEPADNFVKGRLIIDSNTAQYAVGVSNSVDVPNNAIICSAPHGLVDATSLATVQAICFWDARTTSQAGLNLDVGTFGSFSASTVYFVRVFSTTKLVLYATAANAWAQTSPIIPTTFSGGTVRIKIGITPIPLWSTGIFAGAAVVPLSDLTYLMAGGGNASNYSIAGYRVFWGPSGAPTDLSKLAMTCFTKATPNATLSVASRLTSKTVAQDISKPSPYNFQTAYFDICLGTSGGTPVSAPDGAAWPNAGTGSQIQVVAV